MTRIEIKNFDCGKQKVDQIIESFIELGDNYFRYRIYGYVHQWDGDIDMVKSESSMINDDDIFLKSTFSGVFLTTAENSDTEIYILEVLYSHNKAWVRFQDEIEARRVMLIILEWAGIKISE